MRSDPLVGQLWKCRPTGGSFCQALSLHPPVPVPNSRSPTRRRSACAAVTRLCQSLLRKLSYAERRLPMWTLSGLTTHMRIQMTEIATELGSAGLKDVGSYLQPERSRPRVHLSLRVCPSVFCCPSQLEKQFMCSESPFERQRLSGLCGSCESHVFIKHVSSQHRHEGS